MLVINGRDARRVWAMLGLLGLAGVVGLVGVLLLLRGWDDAAKVAGVISIILAVAPLAVQLLAWSRRGPSSRPTAEQVAKARDVLAMLVSEQWRREAQARSLGDPAPIPVSWALTERTVMDHSKHVLTGRGFSGSSGNIKSLATRFGRLKRQRMAILGPAGAGKTTLAVQLLLELLDTRKPEEPVPVLLSLPSWDTTTAPRLQNWLADRLAQDYPAVRAVHSAAPSALAEQGCVLPVLDGLDELPDHHRPTVITAINFSLGATDPLVLTCRTEEYHHAVDASDVLTAAAVIEPKPLKCTEAAKYLHDCLRPQHGDSWRKVLGALRTGNAPALAEVCTTPLGLWLVRMVYIATRANPDSLLDHPDATTLRTELLDQLIPAAIRARQPTKHPDDPLLPRRSWDPDEVGDWLSLLAQQLDGKRELLWWQLARRTINPWLIALACGLAIWLMFALVSGLVSGLLLGLAVALAGKRAVKNQTINSVPMYANIRWRGRATLLAHHLVAGLGSGLVFGLVGGWAIEVIGGLDGGLVGGLAGGLAGGLVLGLARELGWWMEAPSIGDRVATPRAAYRSDRAFTVAQTVLSGLAVGLLVALIVGLLAGLVAGLIIGLLRLVAGGSRAWVYYVLAARWLAVTGRLPWRLMGFLDDAYRLGLLRTVGPAYQFRHAELQDHLAGTRQPVVR